MKKIILTFLLAMVTFTSSYACWFTQDNINAAYIAGVNFFKSHYVQVDNIDNVDDLTFVNDINVSLPLTVWFKVSPRKYMINGDTHFANIRIAKLFYKIIPVVNGEYNYYNANYKWRLAKSVDMEGKPWKLDFSSPVKIFGNNTLTLKQINANGDSIKTGDKIILAWYIADDSTSCIANADQITTGDSEPIMIVDSTTNKGSDVFGGNYAYRSAYVMSVIYNGKKTLGR